MLTPHGAPILDICTTVDERGDYSSFITYSRDALRVTDLWFPAVNSGPKSQARTLIVKAIMRAATPVANNKIPKIPQRIHLAIS